MHNFPFYLAPSPRQPTLKFMLVSFCFSEGMENRVNIFSHMHEMKRKIRAVAKKKVGGKK